MEEVEKLGEITEVMAYVCEFFKAGMVDNAKMSEIMSTLITTIYMLGRARERGLLDVDETSE